jgi:hypothetical protein
MPLQIINLTKKFGEQTALDNINISIDQMRSSVFSVPTEPENLPHEIDRRCPEN